MIIQTLPENNVRKKGRNLLSKAKILTLHLLLTRRKIYTQTQQEEGVFLDGATGVTIKSDLDTKL